MTEPALTFDDLLLRSAVIGAFDPWVLLSAAPEGQMDDWAGRLSLLCDEGETGDSWILNATRRRELLQRLDRPAAVQAALAGAPRRKGDHLGASLRALLTGAKPRPGADPEQQAAIHAAIQFAHSAPVIDKANLSEAYARSLASVAEEQQKRAMKAVLPDRLYGRDYTLGRIIAFALAAPGADPRPLLLTGIGGVGKSAVVAGVVRRWKRRKLSAIVLDFDLPGLSEGSPLAVMREFTRHLETEWIRRGEAFAGAVEVVGRVRSLIRSYSTQEGLRASAEEQYRFLQSGPFPLLSDNAPAVMNAPLLLVFDSFETVGGLGHDVVQRLLDLETDLRERVGLLALRTVIAGRAPPELKQAGQTLDGRALQDMAANFGEPSRAIHLKGLTPAAASAFLASRDRNNRFPDDQDRRRLAAVLKGHPLALMVLEQFARDRLPREVRQLVADLESNQDFSAELAQTFVYTRILDRIRDPQVKQMAHPGLVLREINVDLIRLALIPAFGTDPATEARADELFKRLSAEFWLVEALPGQGAVRHRPDLRRLMLPPMFAGPAASDTATERTRKEALKTGALAVCRLAIAYYEDGPPQDDPARQHWEMLRPEDRRVEAIYYHALAGEPAPAEIDRAEAAHIRSRLALDFDTLPLGWRAVIRAALGAFNELSAAERASLSGPLRERAESALIERDLKSGQVAAASESITQEVQRRGPGSGREADLKLAGQRVRAAFPNGDFAFAWEAGQSLIEAMFDGQLPADTLAAIERGRFTADPVWLAVLAGLATNQEFYVPWRLAKAMTPKRAALAPILSLAAIDRERYRSDIVRFGRELASNGAPTPSGVEGLRLAALALTLDAPGFPPPASTPASVLALGDHRLLDVRQLIGGSLIEDEAVGRFFDQETFSLPQLEAVYRLNLPVMLTEGTLAGVSKLWTRQWAALRGLTPELYEPATRLLDEVPDIEAIEIAHATADAAIRWPEDLWFIPQSEPAAREGRQRKLATYTRRFARTVVETADRCGVLETLLRELHRHSPAARYLLRIHESIDQAYFPPTPSRGS